MTIILFIKYLLFTALALTYLVENIKRVKKTKSSGNNMLFHDIKLNPDSN